MSLIPAIKTGMAVMASSEYDANHSINNIRINFKPKKHCVGAWCASVNDCNQWIQISSDKPRKWCEIITQGRNGCPQWVSTYKLSYSNNAINWFEVENGQIFDANYDCDTEISHVFKKPFESFFVRLIPLSWNVHISMRMEIFYKNTEIELFIPNPDPFPIEDISEDLIWHISSFLNCEDLLKLSLVSKKWHNLVWLKLIKPFNAKSLQKKLLGFSLMFLNFWQNQIDDYSIGDIEEKRKNILIDGYFTIYYQSNRYKPIKLYIHNLNTIDPQSFLDLIQIGPNFNFSNFAIGGCARAYQSARSANVQNLQTNFEKLRFNPIELVVKTDDYTFSKTNGNKIHQTWGNGDVSHVFQQVPYATARDCYGYSSKKGSANIDLRGTIFAVSSNFTAKGCGAAGDIELSENNQVAILRGGGFCGGFYPESDTAGQEPGGGWVLDLKFINL
eukprot:TRINITY_DN6033_c2_g1_i1.p1 TRINITY_DN6033_c2_g1~~TRINITY_DN6033_c2_g1_i1.p1  ORF type:complete len:445 (+),score=165.20 TRINITY_DN6033_c2_g1_i1:42-1376(+)